MNRIARVLLQFFQDQQGLICKIYEWYLHLANSRRGTNGKEERARRKTSPTDDQRVSHAMIKEGSPIVVDQSGKTPLDIILCPPCLWGCLEEDRQQPADFQNRNSKGHHPPARPSSHHKPFPTSIVESTNNKGLRDCFNTFGLSSAVRAFKPAQTKANNPADGSGFMTAVVCYNIRFKRLPLRWAWRQRWWPGCAAVPRALQFPCACARKRCGRSPPRTSCTAGSISR